MTTISDLERDSLHGTEYVYRTLTQMPFRRAVEGSCPANLRSVECKVDTLYEAVLRKDPIAMAVEEVFEKTLRCVRAIHVSGVKESNTLPLTTDFYTAYSVMAAYCAMAKNKGKLISEPCKVIGSYSDETLRVVSQYRQYLKTPVTIKGLLEQLVTLLAVTGVTLHDLYVRCTVKASIAAYADSLPDRWTPSIGMVDAMIVNARKVLLNIPIALLRGQVDSQLKLSLAAY